MLSSTSYESNVVIEQLGKKQVSEIMELETASWISGVQADEDVFLTRIELGHVLLGARVVGKLSAMTCFSYTKFDAECPEKLPNNFTEFSSLPVSSHFDTAFGYSLSVHPEHRGSPLLLSLLKTGFAKIRDDGCQFLIGDGRCPSYNGSCEGHENIKQSPAFKKTLDKYTEDGVFPGTVDLIEDPILRYLYRTLNCEFVSIIPGFFPTDIPAGGFRVMYRRKTAGNF